MSWTGTVTCGYCHEDGHNKRSCQKLKEYVEENPDSWTATKETRRQERQKVRTCGYCNTTGHNRATCENRKSHMYRAIRVNKEWCSRLIDQMKTMGLTTGALVIFPGDWRNDDGDVLALITGINWSEASFLNASNAYMGDLIVVKSVTELRKGYHREFRLPLTGTEADDMLQYGDSSGLTRLKTVASRISDGGKSLDALIPDNFLRGEYGIKEHFKNEQYNAPLAAIEQLEKEYFPN